MLSHFHNGLTTDRQTYIIAISISGVSVLARIKIGIFDQYLALSRK